MSRATWRTTRPSIRQLGGWCASSLAIFMGHINAEGNESRTDDFLRCDGARKGFCCCVRKSPRPAAVLVRIAIGRSRTPRECFASAHVRSGRSDVFMVAGDWGTERLTSGSPVPLPGANCGYRGSEYCNGINRRLLLPLWSGST